MRKSYNVVIHSITDHKMSMKSAAQGLIDYVDDFYRDFESDLVRAQGKTFTAIPSTGFNILRRCQRHKAAQGCEISARG